MAKDSNSKMETDEIQTASLAISPTTEESPTAALDADDLLSSSDEESLPQPDELNSKTKTRLNKSRRKRYKWLRSQGYSHEEAITLCIKTISEREDEAPSLPANRVDLEGPTPVIPVVETDRASYSVSMDGGEIVSTMPTNSGSSINSSPGITEIDQKSTANEPHPHGEETNRASYSEAMGGEIVGAIPTNSLVEPSTTIVNESPLIDSSNNSRRPRLTKPQSRRYKRFRANGYPHEEAWNMCRLTTSERGGEPSSPAAKRARREEPFSLSVETGPVDCSEAIGDTTVELIPTNSQSLVESATTFVNESPPLDSSNNSRRSRLTKPQSRRYKRLRNNGYAHEEAWNLCRLTMSERGIEPSTPYDYLWSTPATKRARLEEPFPLSVETGPVDCSEAIGETTVEVTPTNSESLIESATTIVNESTGLDSSKNSRRPRLTTAQKRRYKLLRTNGHTHKEASTLCILRISEIYGELSTPAAKRAGLEESTPATGVHDRKSRGNEPFPFSVETGPVDCSEAIGENTETPSNSQSWIESATTIVNESTGLDTSNDSIKPRLKRAEKKRFNWLRSNGHNEEEAYTLCKLTIAEREGEAAAVSRKRFRDSTPAQTVERKTSLQKPSHSGTAGIVKVGIVPINYPTEALSVVQQSWIEERLAQLILLCKSSPGPSFRGVSFRSGHIVVNCDDLGTAYWVKQQESNLQPPGIVVTVVDNYNIPSSNIVTGFFPNSLNYRLEEIQSFIDVQNEELQAREWKILKSADTGKNCVEVVFSVDTASNSALQKNDYIISYRLGKVKLIPQKGKNTSSAPPFKTVTSGPSTSTQPHSSGPRRPSANLTRPAVTLPTRFKAWSTKKSEEYPTDWSRTRSDEHRTQWCTRRSEEYPTERTTGRSEEYPTKWSTRRSIEHGTESFSRRPDEHPTERSIRRSEEYPTERTDVYPTEWSTRRPEEYPTERTMGRSDEYPTDWSTRRPEEYPIERTIGRSDEYPTEWSTRRPEEYPTGRTMRMSEEHPTEWSRRRTEEHPTEWSTRRSIEHGTNWFSRRSEENPTEWPTRRPQEQPTAWEQRYNFDAHN